MKFKVRCWMQPAAALGIVMILLSGCAMVSSEPRASVCPPVVQYNRETQERAALEVEGLPKGAAITEMLSDYAVLRDQVRACM